MPELNAQPVRLYDSFGIAPRMVRFFLLEKALDLPRPRSTCCSARIATRNI